MHSRIFQLSKYPIKAEEYFDESRYYDGEHSWFVGGIADYTSDDNADREDDIEWFKNGYKHCFEFSDDSFKIISKKKYFEGRYPVFQQAVETLQKITEDEFCGKNYQNEYFLYNVENSYTDKFAFYVDIDDTEKSEGYDEFFGPLDDFVRNAEEGETYYFGNTIDYHY